MKAVCVVQNMTGSVENIRWVEGQRQRSTARAETNHALGQMPTLSPTDAECRQARCLPLLLVSAENVHEN